ncbi:MAG: phosphate ABC transporter substrate-binding protein [Anaerolineae bacterium]|nr:phosphate ABC transporter substrate-binding protein [Anaerolineae bacterium]
MLLLATLAACGEPLSTPEPVFLQVAGAPEAAVMVEALAAGFQAETANVNLNVAAPGSSAALDALRAGEVDLAFASWQPADLAPDPDPAWHATAFARDGLAVIVHPDNPLDGVGLLQLQDLFSGHAGDWAAVGGSGTQGAVHPVVREEGAGARAAFDNLVMEGTRVTPRALVAPSPHAALAAVAADVRAIGYVSHALVTDDVKVLEIEGLLPLPATITTGSYPLACEFWLVTEGEPSGMVRRFIDWILSPAGQEMVGRTFQPMR